MTVAVKDVLKKRQSPGLNGQIGHVALSAVARDL